MQKKLTMEMQDGAEKSSKINQLFSTHPDLDVRIERMEERAVAENIEPPVTDGK